MPYRVRIKITRTWFPPEFATDVIELLKIDAGAKEVSFRFAIPQNASVGVTHFLGRTEEEVDIEELDRKFGALKAKYGIKAVHKVLLEPDAPKNGSENGM